MLPGWGGLPSLVIMVPLVSAGALVSQPAGGAIELLSASGIPTGSLWSFIKEKNIPQQ